MTADPASQRPQRRAWLWTPAAAARLRWLAWLYAAAGIAALAMGCFWPDDLTAADGLAVRLAWAAFMARTFEFHTGIALAVIAFASLALRARRSAVAIGLIALAAAGPELILCFPRNSPAPNQPTLTIMSVNLLYGGADADRLAQEVAAVRPDVIVFQEFTGSDRLAAALAPDYPHRFELPRDDAFGQAIYSKLPFTTPPRAFPIAQRGQAWRDPQTQTTIDFAGHPVSLMDVHVVPPSTLPWFIEQRQSTLKLAAIAASEVSGGHAFIMAGDFNATPHSRNLAAMRRAGLRDANADAGHTRGTTWPRTMPLKLAPGLRLDHILYSGPITCTDAGVCGDIGSDHRPTWARFTVAHP